MNVLELLDEIEDIVETASTVPLTNKIMIDGDELLDLVKDIRTGLPDDIQQAKWIKDKKMEILAKAKEEYGKVIEEAQKQAQYLVDTHDITMKAQKKAEGIIKESEEYSKELKMKTFEYVDKVLYNVETMIDEINTKYFGQMYTSLDNSFQEVAGQLESNRSEIHQLASRTKNDEEWMYKQVQRSDDLEIE